jgi:hypothetical protein
MIGVPQTTRPKQPATQPNPVTGLAATLARQNVPEWLMAEWTARVADGGINAEQVFTLLRVWLMVKDDASGKFGEALAATFNPPTGEEE